ncbi:Phosphoribosyl-AMP cyclohydrolase [Pyrobaculum neutrophilum V24Sta]|uniref:Phosphoribosyl-AMP cyclohydrolase n=1 Tax=Pyrobaculum neutrophilum (strain DSM 2338 / JCM 9278 / NBRC 100436 / V24Sta) TaxID=444157 RepID=B1YAM7_PYRNV|nr:Phosphoribosyl-AMP cyclohydrolase [Pyrobaculum neutrophilum V24Sta]
MLINFPTAHATMPLPVEPRPLASPEEAWRVAKSLNYRHIGGTVVAVVQDVETKDVLMVGYMDPVAVVLTLTTGMAHYYSTTRNRIWLKGETSGHYQIVREFRTDCDGDAVVLKVVQIGVACHLGTRSCFESPNSLRIRL